MSMFKKLRKQFKASVRRQLGLPDKKPKALYGNDPWDDIKALSHAFAKPITTVFDVGAHTGDISSFVLSHYHDANVFAFEPHRPSFLKLTSTLQDTRLQAFEMAVGEQSGTSTFYEYGVESTINSLVPNAAYAHRFDRKAQAKEVQVITLDEFCLDKGIERISVLKIDTEGHDLAVLKGATGLLKRGAVDFIIFEFNDFGTRDGASGGSLNEIGLFLSQVGMRFVATYTDYIVTKGEMFAVANALAVLPSK